MIEAYQGTILLVTHDRYLVDALATQIWEIPPDVGSEMKLPILDVFNGTYSQRREERERLTAVATGLQNSETSDAGRKTRRQDSADSVKAERKKRAQVQELENRIALLEARLAEIGRKLENPPADPAEVMKLGNEYEAVQKEMDEKINDWELLQA